MSLAINYEIMKKELNRARNEVAELKAKLTEMAKLAGKWQIIAQGRQDQIIKLEGQIRSFKSQSLADTP